MNLSTRLYKLAGSPLASFKPEAQAEVRKVLSPETIKLFTKRGPNQQARTSYLVKLVMDAAEEPRLAKRMGQELAFMEGLLKREAMIRRRGFRLALSQYPAGPLKLLSVRGSIGVTLLRGSYGMDIRPYLVAPGMPSYSDPGGLQAHRVEQAYQNSPLFKKRLPETPDDVMAFLKKLQLLVETTLNEIGEYIAEGLSE